MKSNKSGHKPNPLKVNSSETTQSIRDGIYEYISDNAQLCPVCKSVIGRMPGMRDAVCHTCGFKDPCCE